MRFHQARRALHALEVFAPIEPPPLGTPHPPFRLLIVRFVAFVREYVAHLKRRHRPVRGPLRAGGVLAGPARPARFQVRQGREYVRKCVAAKSVVLLLSRVVSLIRHVLLLVGQEATYVPSNLCHLAILQSGTPVPPPPNRA